MVFNPSLTHFIVLVPINVKFKSISIRTWQLKTINTKWIVIIIKSEIMWLFNCAQLLRPKTGFIKMEHHRRNVQKSHQLFWCASLIVMIHLTNSQIDAHTANGTRLTVPSQHYRGSKYTIDDLIYGKWPYKVSNDIDMDPCKASKLRIRNSFRWNPFWIFYLILFNNLNLLHQTAINLRRIFNEVIESGNEGEGWARLECA